MLKLGTDTKKGMPIKKLNHYKYIIVYILFKCPFYTFVNYCQQLFLYVWW